MIRRIIALFAVIAVIVVAVLAYAFLRPSEEASAPIEAIPLATSAAAASAPVPTDLVAGATPAPTTAPQPEPTANSVPATLVVIEPTLAPTDAPAAAESVLLQIAQEQSTARFTINEVLNGAPKTVIGTTNQVAGEIAVDPNDPTNTRVGTIQINARTLTTDNDFRNRAIKNRILLTDQYEFITFVPTAITGLPASGTIGESYNFQITGDLAIRDVTSPVTFDVTVQPTSNTQLTGTAQTTIRYADYNISIPQVPSVAGVEETVVLELDFVALAK